MTLSVTVDLVAGLFGLASSFEWLRSAQISFPFGYDMDAELGVAMKKAARLNARAALLAGVAIAIASIKAILVAVL